MIRITYKKKNKDAIELLYDDNSLDYMWANVKWLLDNWAEILWVYKINK